LDNEPLVILEYKLIPFYVILFIYVNILELNGSSTKTIR
jgi:hypothetical protein